MADCLRRQPIFYVGLEAVFEVWLWDPVARLWFVMTTDAAAAAEQGAVGFHPLHTRHQLIQMRDQWRAHRAAGGNVPAGTSRH